MSHTFYKDGHEFELSQEPAEYQDNYLAISDHGRRAVVGYLSPDSDPADPRKEFDNVGKMICFHSRYTLGDEHSYKDTDEFRQDLCRQAVGDAKWEGMLEHAEKRIDGIYRVLDTSTDKGRMELWRQLDEIMQGLYDKILQKNYIILPLYLYDHSGITMSTGSFSCPWDSGQVGWIYCSKETALKEWGGKILTKKVRDRAAEYLTGEVAEYDTYLTGDVWGVCYDTFTNVSEDPTEPEWELDEADSCWGYYGGTYAEEELKRGIEFWSVEIEKPTPFPVDPEQPNLFDYKEAA